MSNKLFGKKGITFGKISLNLNKDEGKKLEPTEIMNEVNEGGFGTFKPVSDAAIAEHETNEMRELMGFAGFGKKAKQFNIDDMLQQAKQINEEKSISTSSVAEKLQPLSLENKDDESDDELIGPPVPKPTTEEEEEDDDDDEIIGPLPPADFQQPSTSKGENTSDAEDGDDSETEDDNVRKKIPITHEVQMVHGSKAVIAIDVDAAGARLATGSVDYEVKFWDFAGMDSSCQSFRTLMPCENHPIKALKYSITGDLVLVIAGNAQAKVVDRDGYDRGECKKGDQYIADMAMTKGHVASLTSGCWHPRIREEFLTASEDGTMRMWEMYRLREHINVIKCRAQNGLRAVPTACTYSRDGNMVAAACNDGSIQMWDHRKQFVNTCMLLRKAHENGTETSSIMFSYLEKYLITRGGDETLKLWDLRHFKKPVNVATDLYSRYATTECMFSPDDSIIVTGTSMKKGETEGKVIFFDRNTFERINEIAMPKTHVIRTHWHQKLNQIFVGCGNGIVTAYYDEKTSLRGAMLCVGKARKKVKQMECVGGQQIITPHALPMFRQDKPKSLRKQMEKDRLDPVKSRRPELPITAKGQGGRVASSGSTLSSYVIRNLGISKKIDDEKDPREAILKYAKDAAENPYWIAPAYKKTQPTPIFRPEEEEEDDEPTSKKQKI